MDIKYIYSSSYGYDAGNSLLCSVWKDLNGKLERSIIDVVRRATKGS